MSYRIVYGYEPDYGLKKKIRWRFVAGFTGVCMVLFGIFTSRFWPSGWNYLMEVILPGDPSVTRQALGHMVENLRAGEAIGDAVMVFCREIVDGAQLTH